MKQKALSVIFLLISLSCVGMKKFTIPKDDFLKQLSTGTLRQQRVYCYREDGTKLWMFYNKGSILTIKLTNNSKRKVMLNTVTLKDGIIEATVYNVWWSTKKKYAVHINDIQSFYIERKTQESLMAYSDIDSSRLLVRAKNDSRKRGGCIGMKACNDRLQFPIYIHYFRC